MRLPQFSLLKFIIVTSLLGMGMGVYLTPASIAVKAGWADSFWNTEFPTACAWFIGCTMIGAYFNRLLTWMVVGFLIGLFLAMMDVMTL